MSEETMEPRTFEDLWLMRETSNAWFDGQVRYENVRKGADPEAGMVDSMSWHVVPFSDRVNVELHTHVIEEVCQNGSSMSLRIKSETLASYHSMRDFYDSEWWAPTMKKLDGGDADASWLRTVELDGEEVDADPTWIGYGPSTCVVMVVGRQYRDWLGNTRQDKGSDTLSIRAERMSGNLWLQCGKYTVEGTVEEIEAAMTLMERLSDLGVEVGDGAITVPLPKSESEAGNAD